MPCELTLALTALILLMTALLVGAGPCLDGGLNTPEPAIVRRLRKGNWTKLDVHSSPPDVI